jgi:hypothetical protein
VSFEPDHFLAGSPKLKLSPIPREYRQVLPPD